MKTIWTRGTNGGKGFWFEYMDGYSGWVLGLSATERKTEERKHGRLVKWTAA